MNRRHRSLELISHSENRKLFGLPASRLLPFSACQRALCCSTAPTLASVAFGSVEMGIGWMEDLLKIF